MKRFSCLIILFLSLSSCSYNSDIHSKTKHYFKLNIDKHIEPVLCEENWSITGEGFFHVIYQFDSIDAIRFLNQNTLSNYSNLPIDIKLPTYTPDEFIDYMQPKLFHRLYQDSTCFNAINHSGRFKLSGNETFSIALYDYDIMKLFLFYYHE